MKSSSDNHQEMMFPRNPHLAEFVSRNPNFYEDFIKNMNLPSGDVLEHIKDFPDFPDDLFNFPEDFDDDDYDYDDFEPCEHCRGEDDEEQQAKKDRNLVLMAKQLLLKSIQERGVFYSDMEKTSSGPESV